MKRKTKTYTIDEGILHATLRFDEQSNLWLEDYIDLENEPRYTPNGRRWRSALDVGCPYADPRYRDCGTCPMLRKQHPKDLIGVCFHEDLIFSHPGKTGMRSTIGADNMNGTEKKQTPIASFFITIHSVKDATWQGIVECGEKEMAFTSELQLLKLMMALEPELKPDISWSN